MLLAYVLCVSGHLGCCHLLLVRGDLPLDQPQDASHPRPAGRALLCAARARAALPGLLGLPVARDRSGVPATLGGPQDERPDGIGGSDAGHPRRDRGPGGAQEPGVHDESPGDDHHNHGRHLGALSRGLRVAVALNT